MEPYGPTVRRRFPLVARPRPTCLPLPQRVRGLVALADTAAARADASMASTVYNLAALIADDVGDRPSARRMCYEHASAYLHATPLSGAVAIRALEPVVNLARLQIRADAAEEGYRILLDVYDAVSNATGVRVDDIQVPADLTDSDVERHEVRAWLWRVLLADGTRALTTADQWAQALTHLQAHRGVGQRMLDGRQVAVLARLDSDPAEAAALVTTTAPGEPGEEVVTACLNVMCCRALGRPIEALLAALADRYIHQEFGHGVTVFEIRLGLTILNLLNDPHGPVARRIVEDLYRRSRTATDGYAARECLADSRFTALATSRQVQGTRDLVHACALGSGGLPDTLTGRLNEALRLSDQVIRSAARPHRQPGAPGTGEEAEGTTRR